MKVWTVVALAALSGCDILFEIRAIEHVDAFGCGMPDEDGDCIADDADNCPGIYNPSQANDGEGTTRDMVGDVCDPQPTRPSDARGALWTFDDPAIDMTLWLPVLGPWSFQPGYVEHADDTLTYSVLVNSAVNSEPDLTIEAGFTFTAWSTTASNGRLGVWLDMPDTGDDGQACLFDIYSSAAGMDSILLQERLDAGGNARRKDIPALQPGDELVISLRRHRNPDAIRCHVLVNGDRYEVADVSAGGTWPAGGRLGITSGRASAKLRYVVTYVSQ